MAKEAVHYYLMDGQLHLAASEIAKGLEAEYIGTQVTPNGPGIPLYNLLVDIEGHPKGSTVAEQTLFAHNVRHMPPAGAVNSDLLPDRVEEEIFMYVVYKPKGATRKTRMFMSPGRYRDIVDSASEYILEANGPHSLSYVCEFRERHRGIALWS